MQRIARPRRNGAGRHNKKLNSYDKLGQLVGKKVGGTNVDGTGCFQNVNYSYNIRGWLKGINDTDDLTKDSDPADLFAFKVNYDTQEQDLDGVDELYNGNIAETYWRTGNDDVLRMYGYQYDGLNRLKDAHYAKHTGSSLVDVDSFRESLVYDKNGNITHLGRNGGMDLSDEAIEIDDMTYTYDDANPNQLKAVDDDSNKTTGFKDVTNTVDYVYDANGNMTQDLNKNITGIIYNHLNLPLIITFGTGDKIEYFYQADGIKVQKVVTQGSTVTTTDYIDGIQYTNNVLDFIPTAEGYVKNTVVNGTNTYSYVYNYTDHLGNVRLSYAKSPSNVLTILEENNYYPFGMKHSGYNNDGYAFGAVSNALALLANGVQSYQYKFQGQERQDELGLGWDSFKWRNYDPAIARFMSIDILAEKYEDYTQYQFSSNQPVHAKEIEGMESAEDLSKKPCKANNYRNPETGNTDGWAWFKDKARGALESIGVLTPKPVSKKDVDTGFTDDGGGNEGPKTKGDIKNKANVTGITAAAPGGEKTGTKLHKDAENAMEAVNNIVDSFKAVLDGISIGNNYMESASETAKDVKKSLQNTEKTTTVTTYDNGNGYNYTVEHGNSSNEEAKKDSTRIVNTRGRNRVLKIEIQ